MRAIRYILSFFHNGPNTPSMKRLCGLICVIMLCIALYKNTMCATPIQPSNILIEVIGALAFGCLGLTSVEKIFKKPNNEQGQN